MPAEMLHSQVARPPPSCAPSGATATALDGGFRQSARAAARPPFSPTTPRSRGAAATTSLSAVAGEFFFSYHLINPFSVTVRSFPPPPSSLLKLCTYHKYSVSSIPCESRLSGTQGGVVEGRGGVGEVGWRSAKGGVGEGVGVGGVASGVCSTGHAVQNQASRMS